MPTLRNSNAKETPFQRQLRERSPAFAVEGIPDSADATAAAVARSLLIKAAEHVSSGRPPRTVTLTVTNRDGKETRAQGTPNIGQDPAGAGRAQPESADPTADSGVMSIEDRASYFVPIDPLYTFDFLVLPEATFDELLVAVDVVMLRGQVFDVWNLRSIQPHAGSAINLHGKPGTGKTLAAHAVAHKLGRKILVSKTSQLESKYHGEGAKNLDALFYAAGKHDAVLFLDEADSLMSQRFEQTSQGSEQAVNAMRSELLMCLDNYDGLVIFATNFVTSYDTAFDSRVRHVRFPDPDVHARREIWRRHLPAELPLASDVQVDELALVDDVSGREIRRAVVDAAVRVAREDRPTVTMGDLKSAIEQVKTSRVARPPGKKATPVEPGSELESKIVKAVEAAEDHDSTTP